MLEAAAGGKINNSETNGNENAWKTKVTSEAERNLEIPDNGKGIAPPKLKGKFSTSESSYKFEISGDGSGAIFFDDAFCDSDEFLHEIDLTALSEEIDAAVREEAEARLSDSPLTVAEIDSIREEVTAEMLEEVFWEEINPSLEDPLFRSSYFDEGWGEEFYCKQGTTQELTEFLRLCVLTEREITDPSDYLVLEAETELDSAGIDGCGYYSERIEELVEIACAYFQPTGYRYDYNDGCYDRHSGYSMSSESISISIAEAARSPAREKMLAMIELKKKLEKMNVPGETILKLTGF